MNTIHYIDNSHHFNVEDWIFLLKTIYWTCDIIKALNNERSIDCFFFFYVILSNNIKNIKRENGREKSFFENRTQSTTELKLISDRSEVVDDFSKLDFNQAPIKTTHKKRIFFHERSEQHQIHSGKSISGKNGGQELHHEENSLLQEDEGEAEISWVR